MNTSFKPLARALLIAGVIVSAQPLHADCRWWQFGHCKDEERIEGLPSDAPREGTLITIDVSSNQVYLFEAGKMVRKAPAATGSGKVLKKAGKTWLFHTPRGRMKVLRKMEDPVWRKPDWAFIEAGERVPPPDSPKRYVRGKLGRYALDLGDGILIHGTDDPDSIGQSVSHGCVRVPDEMLEQIYKAAKVGTDVYIFESQPDLTRAASKGVNDLEVEAKTAP